MMRKFACLLFLLATVLFSVPRVAAAPANTLVFLGDNNLPPYQFLDNGMPKGASVDVARAIGEVLQRPVEIRLMNWDEAQRRLLAGEGNALMLFARTYERDARYDFTQETLPVSFSLFVRADYKPDFDPSDLDGKRIGVIKGGFPQNFFQKNHPNASLVLIDDNIDGTRKLMRGQIDAFGANTWSELYLLKELGITGISVFPPFHERKSNIGVRKGDAAVLADIDRAISTLKANGEFDRIIDRWSSTKVHLLSDIAVRALVIAGSVVILALAISAFAIIRLRVQKDALSREIGERRRIEEQLRNNQGRLDLALDAAKIGMFDWDMETGVVSWTKHHFLMLGFEPDSLTPTYDAFLRCVHPEDVVALETKLRTAQRDRSDYRNEFRIVRPNGEVRHISGQARFMYDENGKAIRLLGVIVDTTEAWEANEALARSERQFATLVENSPDIFARLDLSLRHIYVSPAIKEHTGLSPAAFIGKTNAELGMPPALCNYWDAEMQEAIRTKAIRRISFTYPPDSDRARFFDARIVPEIDAAGKTESLLVITNDVTERELMTRALQQRERQLQEADRRKDEFLATLAHELRNPLAPIQNAVQLMKLSGDRDIQKNARDIIERQLDHLVQLVNDLLDVNRINQGKLELRKQVIDVSVAVHSAMETSQPLIQRGMHELDVRLPDEPVYVNADLTRLTQVIANLLNNSAKYTPARGKIQLTVERQHDVVLLKVKDNGVGIPADMLPSIFEMFSQVDRGPEHAYGGLGIGLALVRQLVEMHGGAVEALSRGAGQGTEITISLPAVEALVAAESGLPCAAQPGSPAARARVLVVDDNVDNAESLTALLELLGYKIATAHDGNAALELVARFRPDVVFLDIGLPGLSGHEVARRIRTGGDGSKIFLVAVTGWGQAEDLHRSEEAGFDRHIVKPVTFAALREVLAEAVEA
ncbi:MAG TPA: transporter substrate-binding domain-containing protein [Noviherbaspirillum sp.]